MPNLPAKPSSLRELAVQSQGRRPSPVLPPAFKCSHCSAVNRLSATQRKADPVCGRCKKPLRALRNGPCVLLCDVSSSMGWSAGHQTRYEILSQALLEARRVLKEQAPRLIAFNDVVHELGDNQALPAPSGGTELAKAFAHPAMSEARRLVLLSDGGPAAPQRALAAGLALGMPIDVVFCGDRSDGQAIEFMRELARRTGGHFSLEPYVRPQAAERIAQTLARLIGSHEATKMLGQGSR